MTESKTMIQTYTIVFWEHPHQASLEMTVQQLECIFESFNDCPGYIDNICVSYKGKYVGYDSVELNDLVQRGVNHEGKIQFPQLGYRILFRFELFGEKTYGSALLGASAGNCTNSLNIKIPKNIDLNNPAKSELVIQLFEKIANTSNWYWGAVIDNITSRRIGSLFGAGIPTAIHWVNFWGYEIREHIISQGNYIDEECRMVNDNIIVLSNTPFDAEDEREIIFLDDLYGKIFGT